MEVSDPSPFLALGRLKLLAWFPLILGVLLKGSSDGVNGVTELLLAGFRVTAPTAVYPFTFEK